MMDVTDTQVGVIFHAWHCRLQLKKAIVLRCLSQWFYHVPSCFGPVNFQSAFWSPFSNLQEIIFLDVFSILSTEMKFVLIKQLNA